MTYLKERFKYWGGLFLLPIYWVSFLFPRSKKIWLFGSTFGRRFADNPRYLYIYLNEYNRNAENKEIRPIWISKNKEIISQLKNKGYEAYYAHSMKGIWFSLRGKVYFFDNYSKDISFWLSGGAKKINMWHGIPLKKIQHDNIFDSFRHPKNWKEKIKNYPRNISDEKPSHYILTTSQLLEPIFSSAFQTEHVLVCGYPRCQTMKDSSFHAFITQLEQETLDRIHGSLETNEKMVYYMPTFRNSEEQFFNVMDLEKFHVFLKKEGITFCVKLHPKSKLREKFKELEGEQIIIIDPDTDPYVFLKMADVLVTDYSSIYFDYLLMDRPIVFFDYDLEEYKGNSREMYFDYEEFTPGKKAVNQSELEMAIHHALYEEDMEEQEKRTYIRNKVFDENCMEAAQNLISCVEKIVKQ